MAEQWATTDEHATVGAPAAGAAANASGWASTDEHSTQAQPRNWVDSAADFGKGAWSQLNPVEGVKGLAQMAAHPIDAAGAMLSSQGDLLHKSHAAFQSGDPVSGIRHFVSYLIPGLGPAIDSAGDKAQEGKVAEGLGQGAGIGISMAAPELLRNAKVPVLPKIANPNATEAAALDYIQGEGVPVNAAARTGNPYVKGVQKMADSTPLGAVVASRAEKATTEGLRDLSGRLADRASPLATVPEAAGAGVQKALANTADTHLQNAETSYGTFRQIEQQPSSIRTVQTGTKTVKGIDPTTYQQVTQTVPVIENIPMPVDLKASRIKTELQPIYDEMAKWMEPAKRNASAGFQAIKSILDGPDVVPASQAEAGLGGLKELAREGSGRNAGLAKFVTPKLQDAIDQAVSAVDPQALRELQAGRTETAAAYGTKGVLDQLRTEPVQAFGQLTYAKDAGVGLLRQVQSEAPGELANVGRAYLEDLFGKAQSQGAWTGADGLYAKWRDLGPQTKRMLFQSPTLVSDLDKFFLGAKKLAENPNPSGSGVVSWIAGQSALAVTHPATGIPYLIGAGALSKILHSAEGVRALTAGMSIPLGKPTAAFRAAQILRMAGDDVHPLLSGQSPPNAQPFPVPAQ